MDNIIIADTREITEDQWLEIRKSYIGGSDASAILGLNQYKSSFGIYAEKVLGVSEDLSDNVHIDFGNKMEPIIREWFPPAFLKAEGIQIEVSEYPYMIQHPTIPFLSANIDGLMVHPELGQGLIEIKTAGENQWREWQDDEIPAQYYCQIAHYLAVTGLPYAYVVALVGKKLLWKYIPRNDSFIEIMVNMLKDFWTNHIVAKEAPLPAGLDDDARTLKSLYGSEVSGRAVEMHQYQDDYDHYKELDKEIKFLDQEKEAIKQKFMQAMGEAEIAFIGNKKITWKTTERKGYTVQPTSFRAMRIN
jgi:putative phage-type endonuclease